MIKRLKILLIVLIWPGLLFCHSAIAQSDNSGQRRVTGTYAITNATIITMPGSILPNATIIVRNGLIHMVGTDIKPPKDALLIPGDSLFVYPGFIDAMGDQGVSAPAKIDNPKDMDPSDPPNDIAGISPERDVLDYWDAKARSVEEWRKVGFTISEIVPKGEMLPGKSALVIFGNEGSSNVITRANGLYAQFETPRNLYPGTILGIMAKWRELYRNAELKSKHASLFVSSANGISRPEKDKTLEALYPVINGQIPVIFKTKDELEIRRALKLQQELGFKMILAGIESGSRLIEDIKTSSSKVILSLDLPDDEASKLDIEDASEEVKMAHERVVDAYNKVLAEAGEFEKAKVPFAFGSAEAKDGEFFKNMRLRIKNGLSEEAALAALTVHPAEILGIKDFAGTLEKGKLANLVVTTDSLFKENTDVKYVMADGYLFEYDIDKTNNGNGEVKHILGTWKYVSETPGGSSEGTMEFKEHSGELCGNIVVDDPDGSGKITRELKDIHFKSNKLSFSFSVMVEAQKLYVNVKGAIEGGKFDGTLNIKDMGSYSFKATKEPDFKF